MLLTTRLRRFGWPAVYGHWLHVVSWSEAWTAWSPDFLQEMYICPYMSSCIEQYSWGHSLCHRYLNRFTDVCHQNLTPVPFIVKVHSTRLVFFLLPTPFTWWEHLKFIRLEYLEYWGLDPKKTILNNQGMFLKPWELGSIRSDFVSNDLKYPKNKDQTDPIQPWFCWLWRPLWKGLLYSLQFGLQTELGSVTIAKQCYYRKLASQEGCIYILSHKTGSIAYKRNRNGTWNQKCMKCMISKKGLSDYPFQGVHYEVPCWISEV